MLLSNLCHILNYNNHKNIHHFHDTHRVFKINPLLVADFIWFRKKAWVGLMSPIVLDWDYEHFLESPHCLGGGLECLKQSRIITK